jgi:hypothetical protein
VPIGPRLLFVAALSALVFSASATASAPANVPCWKLVLQDSYTGVFDTVYPHACYRQAIAKIPVVDQIYSNTREEIQAASAAALNGKPYKVPGVGGGTGTNAGAATSGHKSTVPTAIIVLAGVAVALLLIGGGGELWRRSRRS